MGLFDFFKRKKKNKNHSLDSLHNTVKSVLKTLSRKKDLVDKGILIDLEFDSLMKERSEVAYYIKSNIVGFLGEDFKKGLYVIFDDEELKKAEIDHIWNFLKNEEQKLEKLIKEKK